MELSQDRQSELNEEDPIRSPAIAIAAAALILQGISMLDLERCVVASIILGKNLRLREPNYWTGGGYLDGATLEIFEKGLGGFRAGATKKVQGTYGVVTYGLLIGGRAQAYRIAIAWCVPINGNSWFRVGETKSKKANKSLYNRLEEIKWTAQEGYVCDTLKNSSLLVEGIMGASSNSSIEIQITQ